MEAAEPKAQFWGALRPNRVTGQRYRPIWVEAENSRHCIPAIPYIGQGKDVGGSQLLPYLALLRDGRESITGIGCGFYARQAPSSSTCTLIVGSSHIIGTDVGSYLGNVGSSESVAQLQIAELTDLYPSKSRARYLPSTFHSARLR